MTITITALYTYPIKSCGALRHEQIMLDARGPLWDRRWMLVDERGRFVTQREIPALAVIQPELTTEALRVTAPRLTEALVVPLAAERPPVRQVEVWGDICDAWDEGEAAAEWVSRAAGAPLRLVRMTDAFNRPVDARYARGPAQTGFSDGYPLLIASVESLDALNERLAARGGEPVPMSRFRPNVVIAGGGAFVEDTWRAAQMGELWLDVVKPCARCVTTTVDQASGTIPDTAEPLATLATFRRRDGKVMFAQNAIHRTPGALQVGDEVMGAE